MNPALTPWQGQATLRCLARQTQTEDCVSFEFANPAGNTTLFQAGQFICLGGEINGRTEFRPYSLASHPDKPERLRVAIKRLPGGVVSNWLLDKLDVGSEVAALPPAGAFHLDQQRYASTDAPRHVALFSAGCGITPMMAMSRWLLSHRPGIEIHFIHSARNEASLIFRGETVALAANHARFHLHRFLSAPINTGITPGRIDAAAIRRILAGKPALEAYLCGPERYMDLIQASLLELGIARQAIHRESFIAPETAAIPPAACDHALSVTAFGKASRIREDESLLTALERESLPIIAACRSGVCGSCKCRVTGKHTSHTHGPLSGDELANGYVLACSTHARGDLEIELG